MSEYTLVIEPLSYEDGGGYFAFYPDLPGCASDGDTPEEAVANAADALAAWMEVGKEMGRDIPAPGTAYAEAMAEDQGLREVMDRLVADLEDAQRRLAEQERRARVPHQRRFDTGRFVAA